MHTLSINMYLQLITQWFLRRNAFDVKTHWLSAQKLKSYILWAKTLSNWFYLHFLLCLAGGGLDVLDPSKEDMVPAQQLLQLQPLLDLLPEDLEDVGRGCSARAHVPAVFEIIHRHFPFHPSHTKRGKIKAIVVTCQWEPLERVSLVPPTPWKGFHRPAGACWGWESEPGWGVGNMDSAHPATKWILRHCYNSILVIVLFTFEREHKDRAGERIQFWSESWAQLRENIKTEGIQFWSKSWAYLSPCLRARPAIMAVLVLGEGESYSSDIRRLAGKRGSSFLRLLAWELERKVCLAAVPPVSKP